MGNNVITTNESSETARNFLPIEDFSEMISEILDEFPEDFFKELSGGVIVDERMMRTDYAVGDDLYTLGQYCVGPAGRQIKIFYGSFARSFSGWSGESLKSQIRAVVRHEFRHHWEFLSGMHGSDSLEAEDHRNMKKYLDSHK